MLNVNVFGQHFGSVAHELEYSHKSLLNDRQRLKYDEGDWTDDSDQMILILLSLIRKEGKVRSCLLY